MKIALEKMKAASCQELFIKVLSSFYITYRLNRSFTIKPKVPDSGVLMCTLISLRNLPVSHPKI